MQAASNRLRFGCHDRACSKDVVIHYHKTMIEYPLLFPPQVSRAVSLEGNRKPAAQSSSNWCKHLMLFAKCGSTLGVMKTRAEDRLSSLQIPPGRSARL